MAQTELAWSHAASQYQSKEGMVVKRESGTTPGDYSLNGPWVLRNVAGSIVDYDFLRSDLSARNDLRLYGEASVTM